MQVNGLIELLASLMTKVILMQWHQGRTKLGKNWFHIKIHWQFPKSSKGCRKVCRNMNFSFIKNPSICTHFARSVLATYCPKKVRAICIRIKVLTCSRLDWIL
jgi:hypothetical protein